MREKPHKREFAPAIAATALRILRDLDQPITAAELATRLGFAGTRETQRRDVRFLVDQLRREGRRVCAEIPGGQSGYWLARSAREWSDYLNAKRDGAKFAFMAARTMATAASEKATGQGKLF